MKKYVCVKSRIGDVPVGTVLYGSETFCFGGDLAGNDYYYFTVEKDSALKDCTDSARWEVGFPMPLVGSLWVWEEVKDEA